MSLPTLPTLQTDRVRAALPTALTALVAGIAGVAGSYAVAGFTPGFVVAPIEAGLSKSMPGVVVTFAIQYLGSLGQKLNLAFAAVLGIGLFAGVALVGLAVARRTAVGLAGAAATVALGWVAGAALTGDPVLAAGAAVPPAVVVTADAVAAPDADGADRPPAPGRRRIVGSLAAVVGLSGVGYVLGKRNTPTTDGSLDAGDSEALTPTPGSSMADEGDEQEATATPEPTERERLLAAAEEQSFDVDGMEPLLSENFYTVDISSVKPDIDPDGWELTVTGAVEQEVTVGYDEIRSMEAENRFVTLRCVGENLNGKKMDTALWTGVPIMDIVKRAAPQSGCECVMLRAADDYFEEFPLAAMEHGFLAYGMNGELLPRAHGYPARALIPGHWGEINVKWLTEIEILDEEADGYWEKRGWHGTGPVNTVAKLHAVNNADGEVTVGGHAYAGTRGIETVEVSTDGGSTWQEATLTEPLPGDDVWRQWKYSYEHPGSSHEVVVRAIDGTGTLQPEEESDAFPSGPTGWVSRTVR
ncbi:sulfite oxidase [Halobacteriales archaeon QS_1_68_17]|nr:MAG: sulfite oxidase [Halobacteriales archaeon QS_1_68_17]